MPPETDNLKLEELYTADQKDRERVYDTAEALSELQKRDAARRKELQEMIGAGQVNTSKDLYHAAVLLLHGSGPKEYLTAHRFATMAALNGHPASRWLLAASLDRLLMSLGQAQVYSTQFEHNPDDNAYQLRLPVADETLLSFEKRFFNVPSVIERLSQLNGRIKK